MLYVYECCSQHEGLDQVASQTEGSSGTNWGGGHWDSFTEYTVWPCLVFISKFLCDL
jgi:hypothetical protein